MRKKIKHLLLSLMVVASFAFIPSFAEAAADTGLVKAIIPTRCTEPGAPNCGLLDFLELGQNIYLDLFGILGSVTLLIFLYGGVVWLTSAGNAQRVEHGKKIFEGALVGLLIIFGSWVIVNFVATALTGGSLDSPATLFQGTDVSRPALEAPGTLPTK